MKHCKSLALAVTFLTLSAVSAMAQNDIKLRGAHFNLNIIGVENPKTADMQNSQRHTIFVGLGSKPGPGTGPGDTDAGTVTTRIYLVPGEDFQVCDGNGFDAAIDCDGNQKSTNGAVFALPCNTNLPDDKDFFVPCDVPEAQQAAYNVYARALGGPGGKAIITTCATDFDTLETICSTENVVLVRATGKSLWKNVTNELTSIVTVCTVDDQFGTNCEIGDTVRISLFAGDLEEWFWNYQNNGLRLAQIRFYLI